jgi:hypothetical protein
MNSYSLCQNKFSFHFIKPVLKLTSGLHVFCVFWKMAKSAETCCNEYYVQLNKCSSSINGYV